MAPAIKAPNRAESLAFPVFSLTWYGVPTSPRGDGVSLLSYCGGVSSILDVASLSPCTLSNFS